MKKIVLPTLLGLLLAVVLTVSIKTCLKNEDKTEIVEMWVFKKDVSDKCKNFNFLHAVSASRDTINFIDLSIENYEKLKLGSKYKVEIKLSTPSQSKNNGWYDLVRIL